ncbi:hypothetical protein L208DRAFT_1466937 [Tricholoma matsutake]|nr:hypothetical protein L208DRAFT_1466937 [Tricholoma matsutake 945]
MPLFLLMITLFTFPGISGFPRWSPEIQNYHERKIFPYKQKQLYDIVADVASYPQFVPFCTGSRLLRPASQRTQTAPFVMEAEMTVGFLSFNESYVSQVTCHPHHSVEAVASSSTPLFKTLSTIWRFQPVSSQSPRALNDPLPAHDKCSHTHSTLVTLDIAYAFANPLHATVSSTFFGQVSRLMVEAFERRCIEVYGPEHE